ARLLCCASLGGAQLLVVFYVPQHEGRFLLHLPGYGYAKVPQDLREHWQAFIDHYFRTRLALRGLVVVMDIRHPLKDYDRHMLAYAVERGLPAHALLTKADKLSRSEEHTSELQSRENLVCRLLLEKKNRTDNIT